MIKTTTEYRFTMYNNNQNTKYEMQKYMHSLQKHAWIYCLVTAVCVFNISNAEPTSLQSDNTHKVLTCQLQTFEASCAEDEVIVIESAKYGRMELGTCVKGNMGYIGCSADVLKIMDRRCSGKHHCEVRIPDEEVEKSGTCYPELKSYLDTVYRCIKVESMLGTTCESCERMKLTNKQGLLSSVVADESNCGSSLCPWYISAQPGQQINITMFDYTYEDTVSSAGSVVPLESCTHEYEYFALRESHVNKAIHVCAGLRRTQNIYVSKSNHVEISLGRKSQRGTKGNFLLRYEVTGCSNLDLSNNMKFTRNKSDRSKAIIGCINNEQSWELICVEGSWMGTYGNCTISVPHGTAEVVLGTITISYGTAVVIIVLVALAVGLVILGIGLLVWKWKRWTRGPRRADQPYTSTMSKLPPPSAHLSCSLGGEQLDNYANYATHTRVCKLDANQYTHVWEMPLPQGVAIAHSPGVAPNNAAHGGGLDCCRQLPPGLKYGSTELLEHCHDTSGQGVNEAPTIVRGGSICNGAGNVGTIPTGSGCVETSSDNYDERQAIVVQQPLPPYFDND